MKKAMIAVAAMAFSGSVLADGPAWTYVDAGLMLGAGLARGGMINAPMQTALTSQTAEALARGANRIARTGAGLQQDRMRAMAQELRRKK